MIPLNFITQWRQTAPWSLQSQVEQDLVLSRALVSIYQHPKIKEALAFRGGTALNKLYCHSQARYSEDIDLVQVEDKPIGSVMTAIRESLDPWLGQARWKQTPRSVKFIYRFQSEDYPLVPLRLKIEINTVEPFSILGFIKKPYQVDSDWFSGKSTIKTYTLEELMGTKLRALYQRSKGRDLYDLWMAVTNLGVDCQKVVDVFNHYNKQNKVKITRAEYEKNNFFKEKSAHFLADAKQVLPLEQQWDPKFAFQLVSEKLITQLSGKPWKNPEQ